MFTTKSLNELVTYGSRLSRVPNLLSGKASKGSMRLSNDPYLNSKGFCQFSKGTGVLGPLRVDIDSFSQKQLISPLALSMPRERYFSVASTQIYKSVLGISPYSDDVARFKYSSGFCQRQMPWASRQKFGYSHARTSSSSTPSECDKIYGEVADLIVSKAANVLVMVGAGISTPSGIPDFRTPGTGLYDNLQKYNLPYPEAIFDIHYFMMDPRPFLALAQELYPGVKYEPNVVHHFLQLLHENQKLQKVYTQNIDGLERMAGIPEEKLMEAHGTFATASCTLCGKMHSSKKVKEAILQGEIPKCEGTSCKGKVKPDIVFFGENLPERFWDYHNEIHFTDLLLVIGTSLEVYPFAGIAEAVNRQTPRVLINREPVGSFGMRSTDFMLLGDLEDTVRHLARALGWEKRLEDLSQSS